MQSLSLIPECTIGISTVDDGSVASYEDLVRLQPSDSKTSLYLPEHRHGTDVIFLTKENISTPPVAGDIIVTNSDQVIVAHQFADCVPFLCIDRTKKAFVFSHLGWKGLLTGGIQISILSLLAFAQSEIQDLWVWIGPCIQKASYVFSDKPIQAGVPTWQGCIEESANSEKTSWSIDLPQFIMNDCARIGLDPAQIINDGRDTYTMPEMFFSHQRSINQNEPRGVFSVLVSL